MLHLLEVQSRGRDLEDGLVVDLDGVGVWGQGWRFVCLWLIRRDLKALALAAGLLVAIQALGASLRS